MTSTIAQTFDHILNWKLKEGSHDFPGPDGGTCINEAAVVAAGFAYRKIDSERDCPPCFSRVIAAYALRLNDSMPDDLRQELLLPFVIRLAGTADTKEVEKKRAVHVATETIRRILPIALRVAILPTQALSCERVKNIAEAAAAVDAVFLAADAALPIVRVRAACRCAVRAVWAADAASAAADTASASASAAAHAATVVTTTAAAAAIFRIAVEILDEAIRLGQQSDPIEQEVVIARLENAKVAATV